MNNVGRILSKVVGEELSLEETALVGGAQIDHCTQVGYWTVEGDRDSGFAHVCDFY